jgi:hypothetical protein
MPIIDRPHPFTRTDIERERPLREFIEWVDAVLLETAQREDLKEVVLLRKGLAKKFYEEIFPTYNWIKNGWMLNKSATIRFVDGNQNYDGIIELRDPDEATHIFLECVAAIDGYDDSLRMEHLLKHGRVSLTAPLKVHGTRASGARHVVVSDDSMMRDLDREDEKLMTLIEGSLRRKMSKSYPVGTWLLCATDDNLLRARRFNLSGLQDLVTDLLHDLEHPFGRIVVVGMSGHIHFEWEKTRQ